MAKTKEAESVLREKIKTGYGVKHCILTDSARSGYALYLRATGLQGEILIPSMMHTPTAVLLDNYGLELVFCDINRDFCTSVEHLERVVSPNTCAVLVTHMFGRAAPIGQIEAWAKERSIVTFSNMVHMPPGVMLKGKPVGSYGDAGFLSFNMDKPLHGIYGGALLTNSDEVYEKARLVQLQTNPISKIITLLLRYLILYRYKPLTGPFQFLYFSLRGDYYGNDDVQRNYESFKLDTYKAFAPRKIHPWQASFAEKLIDCFPEMVDVQRKRARQAISLLSDIPELTLPQEDDYPNMFQYFPVLLDESISRYGLGVALAKQGIETKWRYYPLHLQQKFSHCRRGDLVNTAEMWKQYLLLPVLYGTPGDVERIAKAIRKYIREPGKRGLS